MKTSTKIYHWLPRILALLSILFISLFALDSFSPELPLWQQIKGFTIHLIPSLILIIMLIVAWKWEIAGGIIFIITGLVLSPYVFSGNFRSNHSVWMSLAIILGITIPLIVVGVLFIISHYKKRKDIKNKIREIESATLKN